jgi:hypothetical protein
MQVVPPDLLEISVHVLHRRNTRSVLRRALHRINIGGRWIEEETCC